MNLTQASSIPFPSGRTLLPATLCVALAAAAPFLGLQGYGLYISSIALIYAIIATGLNLTNGYLGLLNLSTGGQVAVGAYVCALSNLAGLPAPLAVMLAVLAGAAVAVAIFAFFSRLSGFFFGLATIAIAEVIRLLIRNLDTFTQGVRGLRGFSSLAGPTGSYWIALALLVLVVGGVACIARSRIGLHWVAIRENRGKALSLGLPVWRLQLLGFCLSGALMSLGGALLAMQFQYIEPNIAGMATLVQAVLMVALGGAGTWAGPVIGAVLITVLPEFLRLANELRLIIYGAALILVVLSLPGGIAGTWLRIRQRRARITLAGSQP